MPQTMIIKINVSHVSNGIICNAEILDGFFFDEHLPIESVLVQKTNNKPLTGFFAFLRIGSGIAENTLAWADTPEIAAKQLNEVIFIDEILEKEKQFKGIEFLIVDASTMLLVPNMVLEELADNYAEDDDHIEMIDNGTLPEWVEHFTTCDIDEMREDNQRDYDDYNDNVKYLSNPANN